MLHIAKDMHFDCEMSATNEKRNGIININIILMRNGKTNGEYSIAQIRT